jgi:hypothetical protein
VDRVFLKNPKRRGNLDTQKIGNKVISGSRKKLHPVYKVSETLCNKQK